jgi:hypothetical protein
MTDAWIPVWILGGPFVGLLFLSALYKGGTSAASSREPSRRDRNIRAGSQSHIGTSPYLPTSLHPATPSSASYGHDVHGVHERSADVGLIAKLSGPISPGAISRLSEPVSPGAISTLSRWRSPGAISRLSAYKSPGAIARLSGYKSPGAISRLSASRPVGAIAGLSSGFFISSVLGLPLLTRSQAPSEPVDTLLTSNR